VLLDCLTLWTSDRLGNSDEQIVDEWNRQLLAFQSAAWPTMVVTNELGWGLVPPDPQARRFRDLAGTLAQRTAVVADAVWLLIAGCPMRLK
jgi:adenosyl cobinamide kinase/adenosyl cobinamide phosphate guanylyltransferase